MTLEKLNSAVSDWILSTVNALPCKEKKDSTIGEALLKESKKLKKLPEFLPTFATKKPVKVPKYPYIHFETNKYTVPPGLSGKTLELHFSHDRIQLYDGNSLIADHARYWGKNRQIVNPIHLTELKERKKQAFDMIHRYRLSSDEIPIIPLLEKMQERQFCIDDFCKKVSDLQLEYGLSSMKSAIQACLAKKTYAPNSLIRELRKQRDEQQLNDNLEKLNETSQILNIEQQDLAAYDKL